MCQTVHFCSLWHHLFQETFRRQMSPIVAYHPCCRNSAIGQLTVKIHRHKHFCHVAIQQRKHHIYCLWSWMEVWNVYVCTLLATCSYHRLAPDPLTYQAQICTFSQKFYILAYVWYSFPPHGSLKRLSPCSKVNEQLYSDILKEETLSIASLVTPTATAP